jgi:hypothetical protein
VFSATTTIIKPISKVMDCLMKPQIGIYSSIALRYESPGMKENEMRKKWLKINVRKFGGAENKL